MLKNNKEKKNQLKKLAHFSSIVTQMAAIILLGAYLGGYIDEKNNYTSPFFTTILSLIGVFLALYYMFNKVKTINGEE